MSHGKMTKRGRSQYVESWIENAKSFIVSYFLCGATGYRCSINEDGFDGDSVRRAIRDALHKAYSPITLDEIGRCESCAKIKDEK